MTLTKGQATRKKIERAARMLAVEKGFSAASQREIAERAGVDKSLVQYHFPEKQGFITSFIDDMLDLETQFIELAGWDQHDYFSNLLVIGGMHFAYLLESKKMKKITPDLLGHRAAREALIDFEIEWATSYLDRVPQKERESWRTIITLMMGGAYELVYRQAIGKNERIAPEELIKTCVSLQMGYLDYGDDEIATTLKAYDEARYEKTRLIAFLDERLFG